MMHGNIPNQVSAHNTFPSYPTNGSQLPNLNGAIHSDMLANILNNTIRKNIESYSRLFSKMEKEVVKYLHYYFKKWDGNVQIPIKNLCDRFGCSARWIHALLKRIYDAGLVVTTHRGYGRKVTRRTFTERGMIVINSIQKGYGFVKQDIPKKTADYCADYSRGNTNYISSEVDKLKEEDTPFTVQDRENAKKHCDIMRQMLKKE